MTDRDGGRVVVVTRRALPGAGLDRLAEHVEVVRYDGDAAPSFGQLVPLLGRADGLLSLTTDRVDARLLDAAPRLRVVSNAGVGTDNLDLPELTIEFHFYRHAAEPLILNYRPNVVRLQKGHDVCQTTPRNGNVPGKILTTCDHARFCVGRKPHRLRLVELWILKCCQPEEPVQHGGRQALLLHIKKI